MSNTKDKSSDTGSFVVTVLVIDDSKTVRRMAAKYLTEAGWSVVTANDGFEALAIVVDSQPDIVFADIMMPRLDGYQTCALIKNNSDYCHIPVLMLSSRDGLYDRARGQAVGSDEHLSKPFTREALLDAVRRFVPSASTSESNKPEVEF
ncbi:MAG: response regulator [Granulosicoccus sp.]